MNCLLEDSVNIYLDQNPLPTGSDFSFRVESFSAGFGSSRISSKNLTVRVPCSTYVDIDWETPHVIEVIYRCNGSVATSFFRNCWLSEITGSNGLYELVFVA